MNHNEEVPDFLGGLGDMLPANVLKKLNELLADSSCQNETSLSPVKGKGMVYGGEVITLSIDQRDEPFA